jgi:hypothetical protein
MLPGRPHPLGATWDGAGVNFAIYSENAEFVELCLFDDVTGPRRPACDCPSGPPTCGTVAGVGFVWSIKKGNQTAKLVTRRWAARRSTCWPKIPLPDPEDSGRNFFELE